METDDMAKRSSASWAFVVLVWVIVGIEFFKWGFAGYRLIEGTLRLGFVGFGTYLVNGVHLALAVGCVAVIARRDWGIHFVRASAMWGLALQAQYIPMVLHGLPVRLFGIWPDRLLGGMTLGLMGVMIGYWVLLAGLVVSGGMVDRLDGAYAGKGQKTFVEFVVIGLTAMAAGFVFRHLGYETAAMMMLSPGAILLMAFHCVGRDGFLARSALAVSASMVLTNTVGSTDVRTVEIWLPAVVIGVAGLWERKRLRGMRYVAAAVPVMLLTMGLMHMRVLIPRWTLRSVTAADLPTLEMTDDR